MSHRHVLQCPTGDQPSADVQETVLMALARSAAQGDARATRSLLSSIAPRVTAVVRVVLGPGDPEADDVVQQSLIAFVQALPSFRGECQPPRFASRIAVRTAMAAKKRARARRERHDHEAEVDGFATTGASPSRRVLAERRKHLLRELLCQIPEEQAEALALRVVLGWTLEEVAVASGVPQNTVRSRVRLAKEALRRRIEADPILRETLEVES